MTLPNLLSAALLRLYSDSRMQAYIYEALEEGSPNEASWQQAKKVLQKSAWVFNGDLDLEDTTDVSYSSEFDKKSLNTVILGIIFQSQINSEKIFMRRIEKINDDLYCLIMSAVSTENLAMLAPGMNLNGRSVEAGRAQFLF